MTRLDWEAPFRPLGSSDPPPPFFFPLSALPPGRLSSRSGEFPERQCSRTQEKGQTHLHGCNYGVRSTGPVSCTILDKGCGVVIYLNRGANLGDPGRRLLKLSIHRHDRKMQSQSYCTFAIMLRLATHWFSY